MCMYNIQPLQGDIFQCLSYVIVCIVTITIDTVDATKL